jgi:hypothetical protein
MSAAVLTSRRQGILRQSPWDALLVALAAGHGVLLTVAPIAPVIAVGLWWNSNTIAHNFIHRPFFRARRLNRLFALYQTVLLGVPQTLWRDRHLAHHAGVAWQLRLTRQLVVEAALTLGTWSLLLILSPRFFLTVYMPAYGIGLGLCCLQGHYEHVRGTVSHYGTLYNLIFFNDGYHVEHHAHPQVHWRQLPERADPNAERSRWPAVLRWLDGLTLAGLERWVLRSKRLRQFVLMRHEEAFRRLLPKLPPVQRIGIVGGGLFPRTFLICKQLFPNAELVVIDASASSLQAARPFLPTGTRVVHAWYDPRQHSGFDLLVFPLAYVGDRPALYRRPPAPAVLIHDWLWRRHQSGVVVSLLLGKRLNLVVANA